MENYVKPPIGPMYDYQLSHKSGCIVIAGGPRELVNWATSDRIA